MEGRLVQFMVMRLPFVRFGNTRRAGGNSMGLILDARNVHLPHFSDLRVAALWLLPESTGYAVLGRTSQVHAAIQGFT